MKLRFIVWIGLSLSLIGMLGCLQFSTLTCIDVEFSQYSSTINIIVRDKQTGQPIPNAQIVVQEGHVTMQNTQAGCVPRIIFIIDEAQYETDISGQITFSLTGTIDNEGDGIRLIIKTYADQYQSSSVSWDVFPGNNEINIRLLNNSNQP